VQQAGATDAAEDINIAAWVDDSLGAGATSATSGWDANPTYKCYPTALIAEDPTLASYTSATTVTTPDGVSVGDAVQGPCIYYYGNTSGALYYNSPAGEFKTPSLGTVVFGSKASFVGGNPTVTVSNKSVEAASGVVDLTAKVKGKTQTVAAGSFKIGANTSGTLTLKLTSKGNAALNDSKSGMVTANVVLTSNTDQPTTTKKITL
jgi:hypothetical protein